MSSSKEGDAFKKDNKSETKLTTIGGGECDLSGGRV